MSFNIGDMKLIGFYGIICELLDKLANDLYYKEDKFNNFHNMQNIMGHTLTSYVARASIITNG